MKTVIIGIVENEGKILVGKKISDDSDDFLSEKWHMPGGGLEINETEEEGVTREVFEEANIKVSVIKLLGEKIEIERDLHLKWYVCKADSSFEIKAGSDLAEVKFISKQLMHLECSENVVAQWPESVRNFFLSVTS
jgi:ADP-ribose pyrophosphatase YjhB (NUDIX family)